MYTYFSWEVFQWVYVVTGILFGIFWVAFWCDAGPDAGMRSRDSEVMGIIWDLTTVKMNGSTLLASVRYQSSMNLWQVRSALPSICYTFSIPKSVLFLLHLRHPSIHPCFPLFPSFIPMFPVSLMSIPMSPWSSCPLHIVFLPCSCFSLFHASTFLFLVPDQVKPTLQHRVS